MRALHPWRWAQVWLVTLGLFAFVSAGNAATPPETAVVVASLQGDVRVTMRGELRAVRAGSVLELPAAITTGDDASIALRQGGTTITVAANTALEVPAGITAGELLERVVQRSGNALYNVAPRVSRKLRVETAYLVAVIKGTQFNVAVQNESTTVSLFEGVLEIRTPGGEDVVTLNAGEIAVRRSSDTSIRVLSMDTGDVLRGAALNPAPAINSASLDAALAANTSAAQGQTVSPLEARTTLPVELTAGSGSTAGESNATAGVSTKVESAAMMDTNLAADVGASGVTANVGATTDLGAASLQVDAGVAVDTGAVAIDAGLGASVLGLTASVGADTSVDLGSGLTADVGVTAGLPVADIGVDVGAGVTAGSGELAADIGAGLTAGSLDVAADLGAGVSAGADGLTVGVDAGVTAGALDVPVTVDVGATPTGGIDAGVDVGGLGLDVGIGGDSGLVDLDITPTSPSTPPSGGGGSSGGGGGLLGGLRGLLGGG